MGKFTKALLFTGSLVAGYYIGGNFVNTKTNLDDYTIVEQQTQGKNNYFLKSKSLDESHMLRVVNGEVYMGSLEHLVGAARDLSKDPAKDSSRDSPKESYKLVGVKNEL